LISGPPLEQKLIEPLVPPAFHRTFQTSLRKALMFIMLVLEVQNCFQITGGPKNSPTTYQKKKERLNPQTYNEKTFVVQLFEFS
jgi:hypothetical protein